MPGEDADPPWTVENELEGKNLESQQDMGIITLGEASDQKKLGREVKVFCDSLNEKNEGEDGRDSSDFWQKKLSFPEMRYFGEQVIWEGVHQFVYGSVSYEVCIRTGTGNWKWLSVKTRVILCGNKPRGPRAISLAQSHNQ